jgi:hypothetical protein
MDDPTHNLSQETSEGVATNKSAKGELGWIIQGSREIASEGIKN